MASGFVQRWKGKVQAAQLWLAGTQITASGGDINTALGSATLGTASTAANIASYGATKIPVAAANYGLAAPVAGRRAVLYSTDIGTGARKVTCAGGAVIQSTLAGAGVINFSTVAADTIELLGLSTAYWGLVSNQGSATISTA